MKITNFDRANVQNIQREIDNSLQFIAAKYGVSIKQRGNTRYDAREINVAYEINVLNAAGQAETTEALDFTRYATSFGLKPEDLGKVVWDNHRQFKVIGLNMRAPKSPVQMVRVPDNKNFKAPVNWLKQRLPGGALHPGSMVR